jgi:hypothetical protein
MRLRLLTLAAISLIATFCSGGSGGTSQPVVTPGRAALEIFVEPNPIVATKVSGNTYDFPFEIGIRERGGVPVEIQRVGIEVLTLGTISVYSRTYGREEIARLGYPTAVRANGGIRYRFTPRKEVPDERLFGAVTAELWVEGTDAGGDRVRATTRVSVTR